jgi:argininosuccinate lyase
LRFTAVPSQLARLSELSLRDMQSVHSGITADALEVLAGERSVASRRSLSTAMRTRMTQPWSIS